MPKIRYVFAALLLLAGLLAFQNCGKGSTFQGNGDPYEGLPGNGIEIPPDIPGDGAGGSFPSFVADLDCQAISASSYIAALSFGTYHNVDSVKVISGEGVSRVYGWKSGTNMQIINTVFNEDVVIASVELVDATAKVNLTKSNTPATEIFTCH